MVIIKILFAIFAIITITISVSLINSITHDGGYYLSESSLNWIRHNKRETYIGVILYYDIDKNYIIASRIPTKEFSCDNGSSSLYEKKLEYLILDKNNHKMYATVNKNKFIEKKKNLNIDMKLSDSKEKFKRYKNLFDMANNKKKYIYDNCKEFKNVNLEQIIL
jgi:hypothetical protein